MNCNCPFCKQPLDGVQIDTHLVICALDSAKQKVQEALESIAICENPRCPSPRFVKARSNQKFCLNGECRRYATNMYSLNSWHKHKKFWRKEQKAKTAKQKSEAFALPVDDDPTPVRIEDINLSVRTYNTLKNSGVTTFGQVRWVSRADLKKHIRLSENGITELEEIFDRKFD